MLIAFVADPSQPLCYFDSIRGYKFNKSRDSLTASPEKRDAQRVRW